MADTRGARFPVVTENDPEHPITECAPERRHNRRFAAPLPSDPAIASAMWLAIGALLVALLIWVLQ